MDDQALNESSSLTKHKQLDSNHVNQVNNVELLSSKQQQQQQSHQRKFCLASAAGAAGSLNSSFNSKQNEDKTTPPVAATAAASLLNDEHQKLNNVENNKEAITSTKEVAVVIDENQVKLGIHHQEQNNEIAVNFINNEQLANNTANNNNNNNKLDSSVSVRSSSNNRKRRWCNVKKINRKAIKRPIPCLFAFTLLISATGSYYSLVAPQVLELLDENFYYWSALMVGQTGLFLFVLSNFLIATLIDPGQFEKIVIAPDDPNFNDDTKSPLYKTIMIKQTTVKIKWCSVRVWVVDQGKRIRCGIYILSLN
jgi:hypothetical protein